MTGCFETPVRDIKWSQNYEYMEPMANTPRRQFEAPQYACKKLKNAPKEAKEPFYMVFPVMFFPETVRNHEHWYKLCYSVESSAYVFLNKVFDFTYGPDSVKVFHATTEELITELSNSQTTLPPGEFIKLMPECEAINEFDLNYIELLLDENISIRDASLMSKSMAKDNTINIGFCTEVYMYNKFCRPLLSE